MEALIVDNVEKKVLHRNTQRNDMLKLLALLTMLIDHIGYMFFPNEVLFRIIGRLAFPIFAYQIAMGYSKTSNLKRYTARLALFAFITQIPFSFFNPNMSFNPIRLNVLFTFVTGIGLLWIYDRGILNLKGFLKEKHYTKLLYGVIFLTLTAAIIVLPEILTFKIKNFSLEYGMLALALILLFHIFEQKPAAAIISIVLFYLFHVYYRVALFNSAYSAEIFWSNLFNYGFVADQLNPKNGFAQLQRYCFNAWGALSLIPIFTLESLHTARFKLHKYVGYVFYPAHMTLLLVIAALLRAH